MANKALENEEFLKKLLIVQWGKTTISVGHAEKYVIMQMNAKMGRATRL